MTIIRQRTVERERGRSASAAVLLRMMAMMLIIMFGCRIGLNAQTAQPIPFDLTGTKVYLLDLINQSRQQAGLAPVKLDELASQVADRHCREMLEGNYLSHWNRAGEKPYLRFARAGGSDAIMENVSVLHGRVFAIDKYLVRMVSDIHKSMINERPPRDGHRVTILQRQHTHVGIGIAFNEAGIWVAEEFLAHYLELKPLPATVKRGKSCELSGKILPKDSELLGISLFYEPMPQPMSVEQLVQTGSYGLSDDELILRPIVYNRVYADGRQGEINYNRSSGKFSTRLEFTRAGLYTIVVQLEQEHEKFPASNLCILVE